MVSITLSLLALLFGFLAFGAFPILLARYYPTRIAVQIGRFYFWLAMHSFRRLAIVRRRLSGFMLKPFALDDTKQAAKLNLDEDAHIQDPADRVDRLLNKPLVLFPEQTPTAVDAQLSELGEWWGEHVNNGNHIETAATDGGQPTAGNVERVNPYFRVPDGIRLVDPSQAMHLIPSDADPSDPATAKDLTQKSQEKFRDRIGAAESIATIIGFVASSGMIVGLYKYVLKGGSGSGGGEMPSAPIPMGALHIDPGTLTALLQVLPA